MEKSYSGTRKNEGFIGLQVGTTVDDINPTLP